MEEGNERGWGGIHIKVGSINNHKDACITSFVTCFSHIARYIPQQSPKQSRIKSDFPENVIHRACLKVSPKVHERL